MTSSECNFFFTLVGAARVGKNKAFFQCPSMGLAGRRHFRQSFSDFPNPQRYVEKKSLSFYKKFL
jgi:hypothetical protein